MFPSKTRPIIIPQYEHGRLAGMLAQQWGAAPFERPPFDFAAFVEGVALHDWHYGLIDNLPIIGAPLADWLAITRQGMDLRFDHPVTDIVVKLHLRRLLSYDNTAARRALMAEVDDIVAQRLPDSGFSRADFDWADSLTHLCDNVAFDFCFEAPCERTMEVGTRWAGRTKSAVTYQIKESGVVTIDPWPLVTPLISGQLIGYHAEGYPDTLRPLIIPFMIKPV